LQSAKLKGESIFAQNQQRYGPVAIKHFFSTLFNYQAELRWGYATGVI
jgi:hypothetical protein